MRAICRCSTTVLDLPGPPPRVTLCFCDACRLRTGSVVGAGAYYALSDVVLPSTTARERIADSGRTLTDHACPDCGTVVFWTFDRRPETLGVSVGCIEGGADTAPSRVVYCQNKPDWFVLPTGVETFERGSDGPLWADPSADEATDR